MGSEWEGNKSSEVIVGGQKYDSTVIPRNKNLKIPMITYEKKGGDKVMGESQECGMHGACDESLR